MGCDYANVVVLGIVAAIAVAADVVDAVAADIVVVEFVADVEALLERPPAIFVGSYCCVNGKDFVSVDVYLLCVLVTLFETRFVDG